MPPVNQGNLPPSGWTGHVAIGLEGTFGTPVKGQVWLPMYSESLLQKGAPIRRKDVRTQRMAVDALMGPLSIDGDINMHVTPDKVTKLLHSVLPCTTVGTTTPYTHTFKTGVALKSFTTVLERGNFYHVYPGCKVSRLTFTGMADQILDLTATIENALATEKIYDYLTASSGNDGADTNVILDSAIADSALNPFVFNQGVITLHSATQVETNNWKLNIATGLTRTRGIQSTNRAFVRGDAGESLVSGTFDMVFDSIEEHRRFMGASASTFPIATADSIQEFAVSLAYTSGANSLTINLPKFYYEASGPHIPGLQGVIMQPMSFGVVYDSSSGSDINIVVVNSETDANITTAGTNI